MISAIREMPNHAYPAYLAGSMQVAGSRQLPSGWPGVLLVKTPAGATLGYILHYPIPGARPEGRAL